jgi:hypothetical protein
MSTIKPFRDDCGWKWKAYAGRWLLVTDGGGEQVILSAKHHSSLVTRDLESGVLRDISPSDHVAKIIAGAADVRRHARDLISGLDLGLIKIVSTTAAKAGGDRATIDHDKNLEIILTGLRIALIKSGAA